MLTINEFSNGQRHVTGNRCEKGLGGTPKENRAPNVMAYKLKRMFDYPPCCRRRTRRAHRYPARAESL